MTDLTLYDLMGEDMILWAKLVNEKEVLVQVKDELARTVFEESTHIYAWESLVSFARQVIACDERIQMELETFE